tara:strand:+ start:267 stop:620 length:354 start_codon:yes stop_codon:yes gene_type:complete
MEAKMRIALCKNGKIENIIVADESYEAPDGYTIVDNADAAIGDSWDGSVLTKPTPPTEADGWWHSLRVERNRRLEETDWWASNDLTMTDEQTAYRQALRDLPANTSDPANPTYPVKP